MQQTTQVAAESLTEEEKIARSERYEAALVNYMDVRQELLAARRAKGFTTPTPSAGGKSGKSKGKGKGKSKGKGKRGKGRRKGFGKSFGKGFGKSYGKGKSKAGAFPAEDFWWDDPTWGADGWGQGVRLLCCCRPCVATT